MVCNNEELAKMKTDDWITELQIPLKSLDTKKQQTEYKIRYVTEYVSQWLYVCTNTSRFSNINFIDCMCNSGIYSDNELCTSMRVLELFIDKALKYPMKRFNLFLNDYCPEKIDACRKVSERLSNKKPPNIYVNFDNKDVNVYLQDKILTEETKLNAATILYIDPYDIGTVKIDCVKSFVQSNYCEVLFNLFTSDYVRNGIDSRIVNCLGIVEPLSKDDLVTSFINEIKVSHLKFAFSYKFHNSKNTELYQIIFFTPHKVGLKKLKDALWSVFNGKYYHKNTDTERYSQSLFTEDDEKDSLLGIHSEQAQTDLLKKFEGLEKSYEDIEEFLIERTMMRSSDVIRRVLKPLITKGKIVKCGTVKHKTNYKKDKYIILKTDSLN